MEPWLGWSWRCGRTGMNHSVGWVFVIYWMGIDGNSSLISRLNYFVRWFKTISPVYITTKFFLPVLYYWIVYVSMSMILIVICSKSFYWLVNNDQWWILPSLNHLKSMNFPHVFLCFHRFFGWFIGCSQISHRLGSLLPRCRPPLGPASARGGAAAGAARGAGCGAQRTRWTEGAGGGASGAALVAGCWVVGVGVGVMGEVRPLKYWLIDVDWLIDGHFRYLRLEPEGTLSIESLMEGSEILVVKSGLEGFSIEHHWTNGDRHVFQEKHLAKQGLRVHIGSF